MKTFHPPPGPGWAGLGRAGPSPTAPSQPLRLMGDVNNNRSVEETELVIFTCKMAGV